MSSTNKTTNIELSQYIATDKPTYLVDYNGDMLKIDNAIGADRTAIATAQSTANTADGKADANTTAIQGLDSELNDPTTGIAAGLADVTGDVNTIQSLIGNGEPTTTDKTIIGAINEVNSEVSDINTQIGSGTPVTSAQTVVGAINEIANDIKNCFITTSKWHYVESLDMAGTNTFDELVSAILSKINSLRGTLTADERLVIDSIELVGLGTLTPSEVMHYAAIDSDPTTAILFDRIFPGSTQTIIWAFNCDSNALRFYTTRISMSDGTIIATTRTGSDLLSVLSITSATIKYTIMKEVLPS